jgi:polyisoprenoid-binding protein YceI
MVQIKLSLGWLTRLAFVLPCAAMTPSSWAIDRYTIDPLHTYSSFEYSHWGISTQRGRFDRNAGFIEFDPDSKTGKVLLEIESGSVSTGSDLFNSVMKSESFFDSEHFQKIVFNSTRLVFDQDRLAQIEGTLTIKDITHAVTLEITQFSCRFMILYLRQACGANGYTKILRSDYRMDKYAPFVSDAVTLYFSVEGIRDSGTTPPPPQSPAPGPTPTAPVISPTAPTVPAGADEDH